MNKTINKETVAVFDFDGTMTHKNTTIHFLRFLCGYDFVWKAIKKLPSAMAYHLKLINIDQLNSTIAKTFFKDLPRDFLYKSGQKFVNSVVPKLHKEVALQRLEWHKAQGHYCILATSSYDIYVDYWAKKNGFHQIASTKIEFNKKNQATGRIEGKSCNGSEKLKRVLTLINTPIITFAYGDSSGDKELLNYATHRYYRKI